MKKLLVLLLIAAGAGGVAYFLRGRSPSVATTATTDAAPAQPTAAEEANADTVVTPTPVEVPGG